LCMGAGTYGSPDLGETMEIFLGFLYLAIWVGLVAWICLDPRGAEMGRSAEAYLTRKKR
jgi:hypothetical protein